MQAALSGASSVYGCLCHLCGCLIFLPRCRRHRRRGCCCCCGCPLFSCPLVMVVARCTGTIHLFFPLKLHLCSSFPFLPRLLSLSSSYAPSSSPPLLPLLIRRCALFWTSSKSTDSHFENQNINSAWMIQSNCRRCREPVFHHSHRISTAIRPIITQPASLPRSWPTAFLQPSCMIRAIVTNMREIAKGVCIYCWQHQNWLCWKNHYESQFQTKSSLLCTTTCCHHSHALHSLNQYAHPRHICRLMPTGPPSFSSPLLYPEPLLPEQTLWSGKK